VDRSDQKNGANLGDLLRAAGLDATPERLARLEAVYPVALAPISAVLRGLDLRAVRPLFPSIDEVAR